MASVRWGQSWVEVTANRPRIDSALAAGHSVQSIYDDLRSAGLVSVKKSAFHAAVKKLRGGPPARAPQPKPIPAFPPPPAALPALPLFAPRESEGNAFGDFRFDPAAARNFKLTKDET